jgi:phage N-6-adenine-methyltransferase
MANDLWRTPPEVFNTLNREFNFVADMACSDENKLCHVGYTEQSDSLSLNWMNEIDGIDFDYAANKYVWCNPPYSNPLPWVNKALEAQKDGLGVVMLLNNDMSVGWFARALIGVSEVRCIIGDLKENGSYSSGRIGFLNGEGKPVNGNNKPQFFLIFNPFKIGANVTTYIKKSELYGN